jgi:hypothetical protein
MEDKKVDERNEAELEIETEVEETAEVEVEQSDELEYDDDGNIVIEDGDEESEEEEEAEEEAEEEIPEEDAKDKEIKSLTERLKAYEKLESQAKDTLAKLGIDDKDVHSGLVKLAAETDDKTPEEYLKDKSDKDELEAAKRLIAKQRYDALKKADLEALKPHCPELADLEDLEKMDNFKRFAELRDLGLSPLEAYGAANPTGIRKSAVAAGKRTAINGTKAHLHSNVPKASGTGGFKIPKEEMAMLRSTFGDAKSDKELIELYKKVKN